jgi:hypothetical protein
LQTTAAAGPALVRTFLGRLQLSNDPSLRPRQKLTEERMTERTAQPTRNATDSPTLNLAPSIVN